MDLRARLDSLYKQEQRQQEQHTAHREKVEAEYKTLFDQLAHEEMYAGTRLFPELSPLIVAEKKALLSKMYQQDMDPEKRDELAHEEHYSEGTRDEALDRVFGRKKDTHDREGRDGS